jgi:putative endonuclease
MECQRIGRAAEDAAVDFLQSRGCRILLRNFRMRLGELDIVGLDEGTLAIVEVRTRTSNRFGGAAASVDARKQMKIARTAACLMQRRKDLASLPVRFDVVVVHGAGADKGSRLEWIKHAFT